MYLLGYDQKYVEILKSMSCVFKCLPANCLIILMRMLNACAVNSKI